VKVSTLLALSVLAFPFAAAAQSSSTPGVDSLLQALNPKFDATKGRGIRRLEAEPSARTAPEPATPRPQQMSRASTTEAASPRQDMAAKGPACPPPAAEPGGQRSADLFVPFESGSDRLSAAATNTLNDLGRALTDPSLAEYKFRIEGHTDTVGRPEGNQVLSERRAAKVNEYITTHFGVAPSRLTWVGMGQSHLRVPTGEGVSEPCNRRVQIVNLGAK
jgi:OOP family OmpA-OmpF porin